MKRKSNSITLAIKHVERNPGDHRRWKRMLRTVAADSRRSMPGRRTDPCMSTAVDTASRLCVRKHARKSLINWS
jgi:hypothetical protein